MKLPQSFIKSKLFFFWIPYQRWTEYAWSNCSSYSIASIIIIAVHIHAFIVLCDALRSISHAYMERQTVNACCLCLYRGHVVVSWIILLKPQIIYLPLPLDFIYPWIHIYIIQITERGSIAAVFKKLLYARMTHEICTSSAIG